MTEHRDDVPWWKAELPKRLHRCWPQTVDESIANRPAYICPCGGWTNTFGGTGTYVDKNRRRKDPDWTPPATRR